MTNNPAGAQPNPTPWAKDVTAGTLVTAPVLLVYLAMGVTYGVWAIERGLSPFNAVLMSVTVYAGTAQLIGAEMIGLAVPAVSILVTTLVINSRFFVMAASLAPNLGAYSPALRVLYGMQWTDATFAIHTSRFAGHRPSKVEIFTTNVVGHVVWVSATALGVVVGQTFGNLDALGIDFAMPAMFIALLMPLIRNLTQVAVALVASAATLAFHAAGFAYWTILAATLVAVIVGFARERWTKTQSA
jgi:4-azaleucine resistance transporter AzlC